MQGEVQAWWKEKWWELGILGMSIRNPNNTKELMVTYLIYTHPQEKDKGLRVLIWASLVHMWNHKIMWAPLEGVQVKNKEHCNFQESEKCCDALKGSCHADSDRRNQKIVAAPGNLLELNIFGTSPQDPTKSEFLNGVKQFMC